MKHFIITRFNYPKNYPHLAERLGLFFQYTLPSIKAQTCQNFEWLILCDYPPVAVAQATYLEPGKYCGTELQGKYIDYMQNTTKDEDLVLMTRFDNDDILLPNFVEDIQKAAITPGLYEAKGSYLDLRVDKFYTDTLYNNRITSPFSTLAELPSDKMKTVYHCPHAKMWEKFPLTIISKLGWVQVIHDTNWVMGQGNPPNYFTRRGRECAMPEFVAKLVLNG
jgi:N-acetylglucosaminyl-diphospho-decaprenol L-rhamnosyltransferase